MQMAKFLHQRLQQNRWLEEYHENMFFGTANLGAFVRRNDGSYAKTTQNPAVLRAVELIGPTVAFTMSTDSVSAVLEGLDDELTEIPFTDGTWLQVVPSISQLDDSGAYSEYGFSAVLCRREHFILVCASSPPELFAQGTSLEAHLVSLVCSISTISSHIPLIDLDLGCSNSSHGPYGSYDCCTQYVIAVPDQFTAY